MAYEQVFDYMNRTGNTGLSGIFGYVANISPAFAPMLLFSIFIIILLGSYYSQIRTRGFGDFLGSFAVAGVVTAVISVILYMIQPPIVNGITVVVCIAVAILGVASVYTSSER